MVEHRVLVNGDGHIEWFLGHAAQQEFTVTESFTLYHSRSNEASDATLRLPQFDSAVEQSAIGQ